MNSQVGTITRIAVTALFVGVAAVACTGNGNGSGTQPVSTAAPQTSTTDQSMSSLEPTDSPMFTDSPIPSDSPAAVGGAATTDPVDSDLTNIQNQLNKVNDSLSGTDPDSAGGE